MFQADVNVGLGLDGLDPLRDIVSDLVEADSAPGGVACRFSSDRSASVCSSAFSPLQHLDANSLVYWQQFSSSSISTTTSE